MTQCRISRRTKTVAADVRFGVTDRLGREIGTRITLVEVEFAPAVTDDEKRWGYSREPGVVFYLSQQATRNGKDHQASHETDYFQTAAEAMALVEGKVTAARKRAMAPAARLKA